MDNIWVNLRDYLRKVAIILKCSRRRVLSAMYLLVVNVYISYLRTNFDIGVIQPKNSQMVVFLLKML